MFVPIWLFYLGTGSLMAVVTLVWAMRTRQFEDQERARFLPLAGLSPEELAAPAPPRRRAVRLGLLGVLASGGVALAAGLAVVLRHI